MPETLGQSGLVVVGVADMALRRLGEASQLITYALGSCVGLTIYDPVAKVGGLLHYMLPQPAPNQDPDTLQPFMFATTGMALLFRRSLEAGARKGRLVVCAAGAGEIMCESSVFAVGKRNHTMLRKILWKEGITLAGEDVGGNCARTMTLDLATGEVTSRGREGLKILNPAVGQPLDNNR